MQTSLSQLGLAQTPEQIFEEKIQLAQSRVTHRVALQQALAQKQLDNTANRYHYEANLVRETMPRMMKQFAVKKDRELPPQEKAMASFRNVTLLYFLSNRDDIVDKIRREFVVNRCHLKPTIKQILDFLLPEAYPEYHHLLSSADKAILYDLIEGSVPIADIFNQTLVYPLEGDRQVDLHILQDMNAFYGQIIGVLSGIGKEEWAERQSEEAELQEELSAYPVDQDNFPNPAEMQPIAEDLRIFLIGEAMRLQIQNILNHQVDDGKDFSSMFCQMLLAKYGPETGDPQNYEILRRFHELPSVSASIGKKILGIFSDTKEKFLNRFEQNHQTSQPVEKVYSILKIISELGNLDLEKHGDQNELFNELARVFSADLRQALTLIKNGTNLEAEIILSRIISAGTLTKAKLINKI